MGIDEYLDKQKELINSKLSDLIPQRNVPWQQLYTGARYSLLGPGKRLRPILALAVNETFKGDPEQALIPACALELIHTYSLIHDDLPALDNDEFRRGVPTLHKIIPEGHAILVGDYLLTKAFQVIGHSNLTCEQKIALVRILADCAGGEGMIAGQIMDLEAQGKEITLEYLNQMHKGKTGALFKASIEFGGVLANVEQAAMSALQQFADHIGLAFQIVDDLLDITASVAKHGRHLASDLVNRKPTYATLLGIDQAKKEAHLLLARAKDILDEVGAGGSVLYMLADKLVLREI